MKILMSVVCFCLCIFFLASCSGVSFKKKFDYQYDYRHLEKGWHKKVDDALHNPCPKLGRPSSTQGHSLCAALLKVDSDLEQLNKKILNFSDRSFGVAQIGLGVASAGALASESHISVLEGLGITVAALAGIKNFRTAHVRRDAYVRAAGQLSCIQNASVHLLWDDSHFYKLRSYRHFISNSMGSIQGMISAKALDKAIDPAVAEQLLSKAETALHLTERALAGYAGLGFNVEKERIEIIAAMRRSIDKGTPNVDAIVDQIVAAQAISKGANDDTLQQKKSVDQAVSNVPIIDSTLVTPAVTITQDVEKTRSPAGGAVVLDAVAQAHQSATLSIKPVKGKPPKHTKPSSSTVLTLAMMALAKAMTESTHIAVRYIQAETAVSTCDAYKLKGNGS